MSEQKQLTLPQRAAVALESSKHEQELKALAAKYADLVEIKNPAAREQCHSAYMELKNTRVAIQKAAKDAREDATQFSKAVIAEAERLTAITTGEEVRLQALRDDYDAEREREKAAKAAAEKARVDAIRAKIDLMRNAPARIVGKPSSEIGAYADHLSEIPITPDEFGEFADEAMSERGHATKNLREMQAAQLAHEQEQAHIKAEREQLARERAEAAERERVAALARAEEERQARIAREAEERRIRAEREAAEAKLRAEREAHEAAMRKQREEEQARLRAEREAQEKRLAEQRAEIARQQAEIERQKADAERIERERQAAIEAEELRKREEAEAAVRAEAERKATKERAKEAERLRRLRVEFEQNGPGDAAIVEAIANRFDVSEEVALSWLTKFDATSLTIVPSIEA